MKVHEAKDALQAVVNEAARVRSMLTDPEAYGPRDIRTAFIAVTAAYLRACKALVVRPAELP